MTLSESILLIQSTIPPETIQAYEETEFRVFTASTPADRIFGYQIQEQ